MKKGKIHNKDFQINQMLRATEQKEAAKKPIGGKKAEMEWRGSLHKVTV